MITLIKLGGSLVTNKRERASFREDVMRDVARQLKHCHDSGLLHQCILGHGSGSFGHFEAQQYQTHLGVHSAQNWLGYTRVGYVASLLNQHVMRVLFEHELPVLRFSPSTTTLADNQEILEMSISGINKALNHNLIPVVHGDVAFDVSLGGTIVSTETVFSYLTEHLEVSKIILVGEVDGVLNQEGGLIDLITPSIFDDVKQFLGESAGVDVTGGMSSKIKDMLQLIEKRPALRVKIINGYTPNNLTRCIEHFDDSPGTLIAAK